MSINMIACETESSLKATVTNINAKRKTNSYPSLNYQREYSETR